MAAMDEPVASRPYMPGYGLLGEADGAGLLPWSWAEERLLRSHDYWLATTRPDGRPHLMPVWGLWYDWSLWFSSSVGSSKARNLRAASYCSASTDDAQDPVVLEGTADEVTDREALEALLALENEKYGTDYTMELFDPALNSCFRLQPRLAFGIATDDFTGSPTRWRFS
jgi:Pyridoxamine 5'-phosphate oxidase